MVDISQAQSITCTNNGQKEITSNCESEDDSIAKSSLANESPSNFWSVRKKTDLALRNDVVNKTILRTIKKHYTDKLRAWTQFFSLKTKAERKKMYLPCIEELVKCEFVNKSGLTICDKTEAETISLYLTWIIKPEFISRKYLTYDMLKFRKAYDTCLRYYSNNIYERLMKFDTFSNIFKCFITSGDFERLTKSDITLSRTPELYITRAHEMIQNSEYKLKSSKLMIPVGS